MEQQEIKRLYKQEKTKLRQNFKQEKQALKQNFLEKLALFQTEYPEKNNPPKRSVLEEIGNAVSHGLGSIFSIIAYVLMLGKAQTKTEIFAATVYFIGLFLMFTMSCLYHSFRYGSTVKRVFRRFDYSSIYLLIGATFAPILLCFVGGWFGKGFALFQWLIIATGITFIGVFGPHKLKGLHMTLYIVLGWSGLLFLPQMLTQNLALFWLILGGGIVYSLGIIPFVMNKKAAHFIWHFFVLGGAITQWLGIYLYLYA